MNIGGSNLQLLYFLLVQVGLYQSWHHISLVLNGCGLTPEGDGMDASHGPPYPDIVETASRHGNIKTTRTEVVDDPYDLEEGDDGEQYLNGVLVRAFPKWNEDIPLPCGEYEDPETWSTPPVMRSPTQEGYLFVKEMKTGSSSVGGVVLRIARNVAKRKKKPFMCVARIDHTAARDMEYFDRDPKRSFLFTVLRHPEKRVTSQFFHFFVSRQKQEPSDVNFQATLEGYKYLHDYYLKDLALIDPLDKKMKKFVHRYSPTDMEPNELQDLRLKLSNGIMRGYDFIGITERMDESLVAMKMILNLKISDIVYVKAKSSGGFDDGAFNNTCTYIIPSFVSPGMQEYFNSPTYKTRTEGDWMIYRAANKSLDLTIERLGRETFERHLQEFRAAQKMANERCAHGIKYPCSAGGRRAPFRTHFAPKAHDCLWLDSGCGYQCLDALEPEIEAMIEEGTF